MLVWSGGLERRPWVAIYKYGPQYLSARGYLGHPGHNIMSRKGFFRFTILDFFKVVVFLLESPFLAHNSRRSCRGAKEPFS